MYREDRYEEHVSRSAKMWRSFFVLVSGIVGCYILIASVVVFAFIRPANEPGAVAKDYTKENAPAIVQKQEPDKVKTIKNTYFVPPKITTILVLGTDQSNLLTDVVILGFFNRETGEVDLVSVPRDTYITLSDELKKEIEDAGKYTPKSMKITELHSYAGGDLGDYAVRTVLDQAFNLSIDYTVNVSLDAFRKIVDIVGPITMEIPSGGLNYYDPVQNLRINVPGGVQDLNGEMAEGVVRYRATYGRGDLQRIEVQQEFMKLLFAQTLNKDTLINNAPDILATILEYVKTDFKVIEGPKYLPYISKLNKDKLETRTLPGEAGYKSGISYFFHDVSACAELFDGIIFGEESDEIVELQLYNGGATQERYEHIVSSLEADGYVVFAGEDYEGDEIAESRISLGENLKKESFDKYFKELVEVGAMSPIDDIGAVIIVGNEE